MKNKPNRILLFISAVMLLSCSAISSLRAQTIVMDDVGWENIGALSLPEAQKALDNDITVIENFIHYVDNANRITFSVSPVDGNNEEPESEHWYTEPFSLLTTRELNNQLEENKHLPLYFTQQIYSAHTEINLDAYKLERLLDRAIPPDSNGRILYTVTKIYFSDGSKLDRPKIESDDDTDGVFFRRHFTLKGNKPIDKMDIEIYYPGAPSYQKIVLDKDHFSFRSSNGEVYELTGLEKNQASLRFSIPKLKSFYIEGISSSGKAIDRSGSNSLTLPTEDEMKFMRQYHAALLETKRNFKQFKTSKELQEHWQKIAKNDVESSPVLENKQINIYFKALPQSVAVYLIDEETTNITRQFINQIPSAEYYVAIDSDNEKYGLVDKSGAWVIEPEFSRIDVTEAKNIFRMQTEHKDASDTSGRIIFQYYLVSPGSKTLKPLPFESVSEKITDELILVQRETNGPYGVYNIKADRFVIPMKFVNPEIVDNLFIASLGERTYGYEPRFGVYSLQGKEIIAPKYGHIEGRDGILYTENEHREAFTIGGKKLTPNGYKAIDYFYQKQPLLIRDLKSKQYKFIDRSGKILKFALPYDEVKPFSNGMAVVVKDGKYGAINLSGKLVIPLMYSKLHDFQKNLAAAELSSQDGLILIDKNNNTVKKLGSYRSLSISQNGNHALYHIYDSPQEGYDTSYDADGNIIKTYQRG